MRLIDADKLKEAFPARHNNKFVLFADVRAAINQAPEVDAVPVVRCKDCKHYKRYEYDVDFCCHYVIGATVRRELDDFCSRAERREVSE